MDMITLAMAKGYADSQRLGYVEPGKVVRDVDLALNDDFGVFAYTEDEAPERLLEVGKTYTVTTDSGSFTAECKALADGILYLGNAKVIGGEDTGESFGAVFFIEDGVWAFVVVDYNNGNHAKIATAETVHPIDPKYLPPVDSITMNGADGKQYKVTVDASGALTAMPIE